jgi:peptide chain release factor 1
MLDKLEAIKLRFDEVAHLIVQPEAITDMKKYTALGKEYKELDKIVTEYKKLQGLLSNIDSAKKVLSAEKDPEFREMAKAELEELVPHRTA